MYNYPFLTEYYVLRSDREETSRIKMFLSSPKNVYPYYHVAIGEIIGAHYKFLPRQYSIQLISRMD